MTADIKLPPLPEADYQLAIPAAPYSPGWVSSEPAFDKGDMESYATAAILADRERTEGVMRMALEALANCSSEHGHRCNRCDSEVDPNGAVVAALREHLKEST